MEEKRMDNNYANFVLETLKLPDGVTAYEEEGDLVIEGITADNQETVDDAVEQALNEFDYVVVSEEVKNVLADNGETVSSQIRTISMVPNDLVSMKELQGQNTFAQQ